MTNSRGDRVRLATSDVVTIALFVFGQAAVLGGIGVGMWTRLAVVETELVHQKLALQELRESVHEELSHWRDHK